MKFSIITINYNNLCGLKKTVDSVLTQTYRGFEWIIIDGGSTDGSKEYIINLNEKLNSNGWNPITFWCSEPDKGIYNAMNKGIVKAKGDYLNFMNSGDGFYESDTLRKIYLYIVKGNSDVYYGDANFIECDESKVLKQPRQIDWYFLFISALNHQSMFIRTKIMQESGYDESYKIMADYARWLQLAMAGSVFEHIDVIVCNYDTTGISSVNMELHRAEKSRAQKECIDPITMATIFRVYEFEYGHNYRRLKKIINKGGFISFIIRFFLKILS